MVGIYIHSLNTRIISPLLSLPLFPFTLFPFPLKHYFFCLFASLILVRRVSSSWYFLRSSELI
jgi:hypothetical protein